MTEDLEFQKRTTVRRLQESEGSGGAGGRGLGVFLAGDGVKLGASRGMLSAGRLARFDGLKRLDAPPPSGGTDGSAELAAARFSELLKDCDCACNRPEEEDDPQCPLGVQVLQSERSGDGPEGEGQHKPEFQQAPRAFVARHSRLQLRDKLRVFQSLEYTNAAPEKTSHARRLVNG
jgi:hypothetical protein